MRRLVIDTNLYVDWINSGQFGEPIFEPGAVKYLSAVVLMELRAGAFAATDRRLVRRLQAAFEKAGRLLVPTGAVFAEAGETLRRLQAEKGYNLAASHSIVNDVLIALSARASGAVVVTRTERDFHGSPRKNSSRLVSSITGP